MPDGLVIKLVIKENEMKYKITLPIGDWSDDGHGRCVECVYKSNKPVEQVREAHYKIRDVFGFDVSDFAADYGDRSIPQDYVEKLVEHGFEFRDDLSPTEMARIWAFMLEKADKELELEFEPPAPSIVFYGYRDGKHIPHIGYGLFE